MNMKKLFPDEKGSKKGLKEFLDKKGFYIVLLLCIAVVAGTAVYVTTRNVTSEKLNDSQNIIPEGTDYAENTGENPNAQEPAGAPVSAGEEKLASNDAAKAGSENGGMISATLQNSGTEAKKDSTPSPTPAKPSTPAKSTATKTSSTKTTAASASKKQDFVMPVFGEVTFEYARDKVVYSKTLEEWRTHNGMDIGSDRGTPVKVVADGVVSDIKNDPRFGITIIIDHKNGLKTVYANLASDDTVTPNQKVKQGDIIGSVGNTAAIESAEPSHLHFEVLKDNENVDPVAYLPKNSTGGN